MEIWHVSDGLKVGRSARLSLDNTAECLRSGRHEVEYHREVEDLDNVGVEIAGRHAINGENDFAKLGEVRRC